MSLPIQRSAFGTAISLSKRVGGPSTAPRLAAGTERVVRPLIKCDIMQELMSRCCAMSLGATPYFITEIQFYVITKTLLSLTVTGRGIIKTVGPSELPPSPFVIKTEHVNSPALEGVYCFVFEQRSGRLAAGDG